MVEQLRPSGTPAAFRRSAKLGHNAGSRTALTCHWALSEILKKIDVLDADDVSAVPVISLM